MVFLDLVFPVAGSSFLPRRHEYELFAAVSRKVPALHGDRAIGVFSIHGMVGGDGQILLTRRSVLRLRLPQERIAAALVLAGTSLDVGRTTLRVGAPRVHALLPATTLYSHFVFIKLAELGPDGLTPQSFLASALKKLTSPVDERLGHLGLSNSIKTSIPTVTAGPHAGKPRRRVLRIKGHVLAGYALVVDGLSPEDSIHLQARGLGGKRRMGCGLFTAPPQNGSDG